MAYLCAQLLARTKQLDGDFFEAKMDFNKFGAGLGRDRDVGGRAGQGAGRQLQGADSAPLTLLARTVQPRAGIFTETECEGGEVQEQQKECMPRSSSTHGMVGEQKQEEVGRAQGRDGQGQGPDRQWQRADSAPLPLLARTAQPGADKDEDCRIEEEESRMYVAIMAMVQEKEVLETRPKEELEGHALEQELKAQVARDQKEVQEVRKGLEVARVFAAKKVHQLEVQLEQKNQEKGGYMMLDKQGSDDMDKLELRQLKKQLESSELARVATLKERQDCELKLEKRLVKEGKERADLALQLQESKEGELEEQVQKLRQDLREEHQEVRVEDGQDKGGRAEGAGGQGP